MTSRSSGTHRRRCRAMARLCIAGALLLAGCATSHNPSSAGQSQQQQALARARKLCGDFGYTPGTPDFARCAQTEYDHMALAAPTQPAPAQSDSDADGLINYMKQGPVCGQANCRAR